MQINLQHVFKSPSLAHVHALNRAHHWSVDVWIVHCSVLCGKKTSS